MGLLGVPHHTGTKNPGTPAEAAEESRKELADREHRLQDGSQLARRPERWKWVSPEAFFWTDLFWYLELVFEHVSSNSEWRAQLEPTE